jgi:hypothetical protein
LRKGGLASFVLSFLQRLQRMVSVIRSDSLASEALKF